MQIRYTSSTTGSIQIASTFSEARLLPFRDDYSLQFNGVDEYIDCGDNCNFSSSDMFSICFWIKGSDKTDEHAVVSRWEGNTTLQGWYVHTQATSGYPVFMMSSGGGNDLEVEFQIDVLNGVWHFIVITKDSGTGSGTVACSVDDSTATPNVLTNSLSGDPVAAHDLYIGGTDATSTPEIFMLGLLDDISIWQTVLSSTAITNLYNLGYPLHVGRYTTPNPDDLFHYWRMETVSGGYIEDESLGNFAAGLLVNMDASNRNVDVPDGLTLRNSLTNYYKFDDGTWITSDPLADSTVLGNDGVTVSSNVGTTTAIVSGDSAYITTGSVGNFFVAGTETSQLDNSVSFQFWFKISGLYAGITYLMTKTSGGANPHVALYLDSGALYLEIDSNTYLIGGPAATNHVIVISSPTETNLYLNNVLNGPYAAFSSLSGISEITIGDVNSYNLNLVLDEFAWWDRILTPAEVSTLYNSGSGYDIP